MRNKSFSQAAGAAERLFLSAGRRDCLDGVRHVLKYMVEQATFFPPKVEFQNMVMSMLIGNPGTDLLQLLICRLRLFQKSKPSVGPIDDLFSLHRRRTRRTTFLLETLAYDTSVLRRHGVLSLFVRKFRVPPKQERQERGRAHIDRPLYTNYLTRNSHNHGLYGS